MTLFRPPEELDDIVGDNIYFEKMKANNPQDVVIDKPFRINNCFESGNFKDWTTFKKDKYGILIYFHNLKQWVNPPTDTNMEFNIIKKIKRYGVIYLEDGESL